MGSLTRRETLRLLVGAPFAATLACDEEPNEPIRGRLRGPDVERGHLLRDPIELRDGRVERTRVLIVGGGVAGLSAAWRLARRGVDFRLIELEDVVGGTARSDSSEVTAYPWGAHYLPVPPAQNEGLVELLEEMGAIENGQPAEHVLVREPDERVFYRGYWYPGLYPYAGASREDLAQLERFDAEMQTYAAEFHVPVGAAQRIELDGIDAATWMRQRGFDSERLLWLCDYATRDDYGLKLDQTSAWAHVFYWASRLDSSGESAPLLAWPEGNGALVAHMRGVAGERVATGELAVHVDETSSGVRTHVVGERGMRIVESERVILAVPRFVAARIAPALDLSTRGFDYGSWMVANVHLRDRPWGRGSEPAWDNVLYDSPSLGYVTATHQRGRDFGPTVWTYYLPLLVDPDPRESRRALLEADHASLAGLVVGDLERAHPELREQLDSIDVWRWGHAMTQPRVGFLSGGRRLALGARGVVSISPTPISRAWRSSKKRSSTAFARPMRCRMSRRSFLAAEGPWLFSRRDDLLAFGGSALLAFGLLGVGAALGILESDAPDWIWIACVLFVDVAHVWSTLYRVYLDGTEVRRRPILYVGAPLVCYALGVLVHAFDGRLFWTVLAYVAVFHFVRQQAGWVALYDRRSEQRRGDRALDRIAIYAVTLAPLVWWHANMPPQLPLVPGGRFRGRRPVLARNGRHGSRVDDRRGLVGATGVEDRPWRPTQPGKGAGDRDDVGVLVRRYRRAGW